jgi:hypothetical protein
MLQVEPKEEEDDDDDEEEEEEEEEEKEEESYSVKKAGPNMFRSLLTCLYLQMTMNILF